LIVIDCRKLDNQTKALLNIFFMIYKYDASKDQCPLPLVNMRIMLQKLRNNDTCIIRIADQGSKSDIPKYLSTKGYQYTQQQLEDSIVELHIKTGKLL
jgi:tRNA 2-thiouridine synthesizing protein A